MQQSESDRLARARAEIEALDFSMIKRKLATREDGYGWTLEHIDRIERGYRHFLTLLAAHPGTQFAPTLDIDKFWHAHILDTRRYAADCERIFGEFLHHNPYLGLMDDEDARDQAAQALHTLFERDFGEAVPANAVTAWCGGSVDMERQAAWCGGSVDTKQQAAWCGGSVDTKPQAAWCGGSVDKKQQAAWCGGEVGAKEAAAWCGGEVGAPLLTQ